MRETRSDPTTVSRYCSVPDSDSRHHPPPSPVLLPLYTNPLPSRLSSPVNPIHLHLHLRPQPPALPGRTSEQQHSAIHNQSAMCPGAPATASGSDKSVCVMDASCPLGHALVHRLLRRGYTVHAATYGHFRQDEAALLGRCAGSEEDRRRLKLFRADPFDYHSIADAVRGCSGLFYMFNNNHDQTDAEFMVEVEVQAAQNVLEACAQTATMERVVFTSSVTAVVWKDDHKLVGAFDERNWSDLNFCRKLKLWHALAKTLSEKTAWALAMDRGVDMVAINAGLITGPGISNSHPYLKGAIDMYDDGVLVTVDAEFLAEAHVAVYECPTAYGRYLCFNNAVCRPEDAVDFAKIVSPSTSPASPPSDDLKVVPQKIQNKKLNKLMVEFASAIYGDLD